MSSFSWIRVYSKDMLNHFFINTRLTIGTIHEQLQCLSKIISFSTQSLFIGYYVYLLVININKTVFLIMYTFLLALSLIVLVFDVYFAFKKGDTRLEIRLSVERKRRLEMIFSAVRILLKVAVIILSGIELVRYPAGEMQVITFTLSIVLLAFYLVSNLLIFFVNKDLDLIRLSLESDVANSKLLSRLLKQDKKEYTNQEQRILDTIQDRVNIRLGINKKNQKSDGE